jgi:hypothetical protein
VRGTIKDITSEKRLGLIFDVQVQSAYEYGNWKQSMDPDVLNEFPAWRFVREVDVSKPRPVHQQNEGVVRLKTDLEFWMAMNSPSFGGFGVPHGPWGFNSGMGVEDVDRDEAEKLGLLEPSTVLESPEGKFNDKLESSVRGLDPERRTEIQQQLGDLVEVDGDTVRWRADRAGSEGERPVAQPAQDEPGQAPVPPRDRPVSASVRPAMRGPLRDQVETALREIDRVHDDGDLPQIDVVASTKRALGYFSTRGSPGNKTAHHIGIRSTGPWPAFSSLHEVGHLLDLEAIGSKGVLASSTGDSLLAPVLDAARTSDAIKRLERLLGNAVVGSAEWTHYKYLLQPPEIWARAYAQFVAARSGNSTLRLQLDLAISSSSSRQWDHDDFKPVSAAIASMMQRLRWL